MKRLVNNQFMELALAEGRSAYEIGEIPVGAVIVQQNTCRIISKAHNLVEQQKNPTFHAEILAIWYACEVLKSKNLSGYDIYVSLEPCCMCAGAIAFSRLNRLFYGAEDLKQGAVANGVRYFNNANCFHRPEVFGGINASESEKLLKDFFRSLRN